MIGYGKIMLLKLSRKLEPGTLNNYLCSICLARSTHECVHRKLSRRKVAGGQVAIYRNIRLGSYLRPYCVLGRRNFFKHKNFINTNYRCCDQNNSTYGGNVIISEFFPSP